MIVIVLGTDNKHMSLNLEIHFIKPRLQFI